MRVIGINPMGEWVREKDGVRQVCSQMAWHDLTSVDPLRSCVAQTPSDADLAIRHLSSPGVLDCFTDGLEGAFALWRRKPGQYYGPDGKFIRPSEVDPSWCQFRDGILSALGSVTPGAAPSQDQGLPAQWEWVDPDRVRVAPGSVAVSPLAVAQGMRVALDQALLEESSGVGPEGAGVADLVSRLASSFGVGRSAVLQALSAEQLDAIRLADRAFSRGLGFILSDVTGFGKGRINAALALLALARGQRVLMLTENDGLFRDLYRDLRALTDQPPVPSLYHGKASVVWEGKPVAKGEQLIRPEDRLVFSTYSQLSSGDRKARLVEFSEFIQGGVLLLDESHNAAGEATVFEQVNALVKVAGAVGYSSATFVRGSHNLSLYNRALGLPASQLSDLKMALAADRGELHQVVVEDLAARGLLVRREHAPIPPPPPLWVEETAEHQQASRAFSDYWMCLFESCRLWEQSQGRAGGMAWLSLGAWLSRTSREFSMLSKVSGLVPEILSALSSDEKVVVVADLTMEAALNDALEQRGGGEDDRLSGEERGGLSLRHHGHGLLWRDRLHDLLLSVHPDAVRHDAQIAPWIEKAQDALRQIPAWPLSPFDWLREELSLRGVALSEISGRQMSLSVDPVVVPDPDGGMKDPGRGSSANDTPDEKLRAAGLDLPGLASHWKPVRRKKVDRNAVIAAFNAGESDVLLLSRAASTGISVHAGSQFKDQRRRYLIEWGIAQDPVDRVQFWGRVRRRDQVIEPRYASLAVDSLFERRMFQREERKRHRLGGMSGVRPPQEPQEIGPEGDRIVAEWARHFPEAARQIGVWADMESPGDRASRALMRAVVLPDGPRRTLVDRLDRGLPLRADLLRWGQSQDWSSPSPPIRRKVLWKGSGGSGFGSGRLVLVERSYAPSPALPIQRALDLYREALSCAWEAPWSSPSWAWPSGMPRGASRLLSELRPGSGMLLTDCATGIPVRAVVLGFDLPDVSRLDLWSPTQVGVRLAVLSCPGEIVVPLDWLVSDRSFRVLSAPVRASWFELPSSPVVAIGLEGDPLSVAIVGQRSGLGSMRHQGASGGPQKVSWIFPASVGWGDACGLPVDLRSAKQAVSVLSSSGRVELGSPHGIPVWLTGEGDRVLLHIPEGSQAWADAHLLQPQWVRHIGSPRRFEDPVTGRGVVRVIPAGSARRIIHGWEKSGLGFRVPSSQLPPGGFT